MELVADGEAGVSLGEKSSTDSTARLKRVKENRIRPSPLELVRDLLARLNNSDRHKMWWTKYPSPGAYAEAPEAKTDVPDAF
jgi:hypothetical protein